MSIPINQYVNDKTEGNLRIKQITYISVYVCMHIIMYMHVCDKTKIY